MNIECTVYKSLKTEDLYLYLPRGTQYDDLPDGLKQLFGPHEKVMDLDLRKDRKLGREEVEVVMQALQDPGYFLQMPPSPQDYDPEMIAMDAKNNLTQRH